MESSLNTRQKKYVELMTDDIIYTNEEMATICDVDVRTIYRWQRNANITKAINANADARLGQYITTANLTLMDVLEDGSENAKLKAIDMLYKALGKYKDVSEVTIKDEQTLDERRDALFARRVE